MKTFGTLAVALTLASTFLTTSASYAQIQDDPSVIFNTKGEKIPDTEVNSSEVDWKILKQDEAKSVNGVGLVDMSGMLSGCTGTLLETGAADDTRALVLSNGHCIGENLMGPREVVINRPVNMRFILNYFIDAPKKRAVRIERVLYATMFGTDIAIFELGETIGKLKSEGFTPRKISRVDPAKGLPVVLVGVPQTGVVRANRYLRISRCAINGRAEELHEGGYFFFNAFRHSCSMVGGSSGSPMLSTKSGNIVAINNTTVNDDALNAKECAIDRPCEIQNGKITTDYLANYAQRTSDIPSCFEEDGTFNLNLAHCKLIKAVK